MVRSDKPTVEELDKRLSVHEMQCAERYDAVLRGIDGVKNNIRTLHNRAWTAMVAIIGFLSASCVSMAVFIFMTRVPH